MGLAALGGLAAEKAADRLAHINTRAEELRGRHDQATRDDEALRGDLERLAAALSTLGGEYDAGHTPDLWRFWRSASVETKRQTLSAILARIDLAPESVTVTFRYGLSAPIPVAIPDRKTREARDLREAGFGHSRGARTAEG